MATIIRMETASVAKAAEAAARVLRGGGIMMYPTDTLYGMGCMFDDEAALARIYEAKGRPSNMPLPVMIAEPEDVAGLARHVSGEAWKAVREFWPGGLTVVLPARDGLPELLLGGGSSVGIRLPDSDLCREIVRRSGGAVVTTSANRSGEPPVEAVSALPEDMAGRIDLIIDAGRISAGVPSSVVDFSAGRQILLREGSIPYSVLHEVLPDLELKGG